jgi:hypothetical protein
VTSISVTASGIDLAKLTRLDKIQRVERVE